MTNDLPDPIVSPAREGHRRTFSEADKRRIVEETARPGASLSEVARSYGIAARVADWLRFITSGHLWMSRFRSQSYRG